MPLPTCELQAKKPHMVQTVVMKVVGAPSAVLDTHYKSLLWNGGGAAAYIEIAANGQQGQYLVLTNQTVCEEMALAERLRKGLQQLPGSPQVEWVRPLTRRLQRLCGWGDVATTRNDVVRAAKAGDLQELRAIVPEAEAVVDESTDLSQLPALFDELRGTAPALQDCKHDFYCFGDVLGARDKCAELKEQAASKEQPFDEARMLRWLMKKEVGRCSRDDKHMSPFWRCTSCRLVLCMGCAVDKRKEQKASDAVEEMKENCGAPPNGMHYKWRSHAERPLPFYVTDQDKVADDQDKVADEEKVLWLRQELGSDATLPEFCAKFVELLGNKLRGPVPQKAACLKLYALYRPDSCEAAWKKESDLPPHDLAEFQRIWDSSAPSRCLECGKAIRGVVSNQDLYCSNKCQEAGFVFKCMRCTPEQKCRLCTMAPAPQGTGKLDQMLRENQDQIKRMERLLGREKRSADPCHEPAWKKRRRS